MDIPISKPRLLLDRFRQLGHHKYLKMSQNIIIIKFEKVVHRNDKRGVYLSLIFPYLLFF